MWMLGCTTLFATMGSLVHVLASDRGVSIFWIGWVRYVLGTAVIALPGCCGLIRLRAVNRPALVWRGIIGATGQFLLYVAIAEVGLGRGTVLVYLMGVVGAVSGIFILGESMTGRVVAALLAATVGVGLSCRAGLPHGPEWLALGAALCSGVTLSIIRLLRRTDSSAAIFLSQGICGSVLLIPFLFAADPPAGLGVWCLIVLLSAADIGGQLCMNQGLGRLPMAQGSAMMLLTPVFSLLVGALVFTEALTPLQWTGCVLVLSASAVALASRPPPAVAANTP
jgi:drug/metabolite transporter (DMT)-like permease